VLDGYKVLDFSQIVAGPTCTLMMAEMGAEVIKVELAPAGDGARLGPVAIKGRSGYFVQHNRGKKDVCLNAKTPEGSNSRSGGNRWKGNREEGKSRVRSGGAGTFLWGEAESEDGKRSAAVV
jgi:hypothetical protein